MTRSRAQLERELVELDAQLARRQRDRAAIVAALDALDERRCGYCIRPMPANVRADAAYCSARCRQGAYRRVERWRRAARP